MLKILESGLVLLHMGEEDGVKREGQVSNLPGVIINQGSSFRLFFLQQGSFLIKEGSSINRAIIFQGY